MGRYPSHIARDEALVGQRGHVPQRQPQPLTFASSRRFFWGSLVFARRAGHARRALSKSASKRVTCVHAGGSCRRPHAYSRAVLGCADTHSRGLRLPVDVGRVSSQAARAQWYAENLLPRAKTPKGTAAESQPPTRLGATNHDPATHAPGYPHELGHSTDPLWSPYGTPRKVVKRARPGHGCLEARLAGRM